MLSTALAFLKGISWLKYLSPVMSLWPLARTYWRETVIGLLVISLALVTWLKNSTIEDRDQTILEMQIAAATIDQVLKSNRAELERCLSINRQNAAARIEAESRAQSAEIELAQLQARIEQRIQEIEDEAQEFQGTDQDCRALHDPLPSDFVDWLRD